jgi:hypothetical protein
VGVPLPADRCREGGDRLQSEAIEGRSEILKSPYKGLDPKLNTLQNIVKAGFFSKRKKSDSSEILECFSYNI